MSEDKNRTVLATNEDLRQVVLSLYAGLTFAAAAASAVFCLGWLAIGQSDSYELPILLPVLAIASIAFTLVMWSSYADASRVGRAYLTRAPEGDES